MTSSNDEIVLYGGQGDIYASLTLSPKKMPYLMLETADKGIEFLPTTQYIPDAHSTILRLHAFGTGGDLLIRRDETRVFWRFVGYKTVFEALHLTNGTRYPAILSIHGEDDRSLLWGSFNEQRGYWQENRVGKAELTYPLPEATERVEIRAHRVLDANNGQIVAYWTYNLAEHLPQKSE